MKMKRKSAVSFLIHACAVSLVLIAVALAWNIVSPKTFETQLKLLPYPSLLIKRGKGEDKKDSKIKSLP